MRYVILMVFLGGQLSAQLPINVPQEVSAATGVMRTYSIEVSDTVPQLVVKTSGGTGDCDLYLSRGGVPTITRYDYRSFNKGPAETIVVTSPARGTWFVLIRATTKYDRVTLRALMDQTSQFNEKTNWMALPTGWVDESQNPRSPSTPYRGGYWSNGGQLVIQTRAKTDDRYKARQKQAFGAGTFRWDLLLPKATETSTTSVGAFLLANGYEADIEIAPGKAGERASAKLRDDQLFAYCVVHAGAGRGRLVKRVPISAGSRTVSITLTPENGRYRVTWNIAGTVIRDPELSPIPQTVGFWPVCSLENLPPDSGYGDFRAQLDHEVRFEAFAYKQ